MKLSNRTILITGGTSGIGLELAKRLLGRGNTIIVTGRDAAKLDAIKAALPDIHTFQSDVSDPAAIVALYTTVRVRFPALDTLINNAGIMRNLDMNQQRDLDDVTREIEINLNGPVRMVQQFLPHLKTQPNALLVNVSSGLAFVPLPISPVYSATKAALHSFCMSLRIQLKGSSVTVVELAPPGTNTPLLAAMQHGVSNTDGSDTDKKFQKGNMEVDVLVAHAIRGIEAGKLEIRPGLSNVLKIMSRVAPNFMLAQLAKRGE